MNFKITTFIIYFKLSDCFYKFLRKKTAQTVRRWTTSNTKDTKSIILTIVSNYTQNCHFW